MRTQTSFVVLFFFALLASASAQVERRAHTVTRTRTVTRTATNTPVKTVRETATQTAACNNQKRYVLGGSEPPVTTRAANVENQKRAAKRSCRSKKQSNAKIDAARKAKTVYKTKTVNVLTNAPTRTVTRTKTQTVCATGTAAGSSASASGSSSSSSTLGATGTQTSGASSSSSLSSASSTATGFNGATGQFAPNQLALHNQKRALHYTSSEKTGDVSWNATLAQYALDYGLKCLSTHSQGPYGENLAWQTGDEDSSIGAQLFGYWYEEGEGYNYDTTTFSESTGHFTQVVWRDSKQIGCALVKCPGASDGGLWGSTTPYVSLTCEYAPPGNYQGEFTENVLPLGS